MTKKIVEFKTKQAKDILKKIKICIATKLSIAIFNNNGLTISHIITKSINKTTIRELALYGLR